MCIQIHESFALISNLVLWILVVRKFCDIYGSQMQCNFQLRSILNNCYSNLLCFICKFEQWHDCLCAALTPVNCASHTQWSSPLRRLTTAQSCCRASNSVIRSTTHVPQCLWQCMWHSSFQMGWTRCFTQEKSAHNLVWWWLSSGSLGQHSQSACHVSSGLLTSLK